MTDLSGRGPLGLKSGKGEKKPRKPTRVFELPVTRIMTTKQMTEYMEAMQRHWLSQGYALTDPTALRYEEEMR